MPHFECRCCGDCCTGQQIIRLNPEDQALLCEYLGLKGPADLAAKGLVVMAQDSDPRPILRFRQKPFRQCPFLINRLEDSGQFHGLCALHPRYKPLVCHVAPLAREVEISDSGYESESWQIIAPSPQCPGMGQGPEIFAMAPAHLQQRLDNERRWMRSELARLSG